MKASVRPNVGDNLITYGELVFLNSLGYKDIKVCGIVFGRERELTSCNFSHFNDESVEMGMWQGGGNWGNLWRGKNGRQKQRFNSIVEIAKRGKKVVGMPQSFFYDNEDEEMQDTKLFQRLLETSLDKKSMFERITLTWRQQDSYEKAKVSLKMWFTFTK